MNEKDSCSGKPGSVVPVVDRNRCEGKKDCIRVCPYGVFEIRQLAPEDRAGLSVRGKIKALIHGNRQAYVAKPQSCHACGLCVANCPERALKLVAGAS